MYVGSPGALISWYPWVVSQSTMVSVSVLDVWLFILDHMWWCIFQSPVMIIGWSVGRSMLWRHSEACLFCHLGSLYMLIIRVVGLPGRLTLRAWMLQSWTRLDLRAISSSSLSW